MALLERATDAAGANSIEALPDRVAELTARVRDLEKRLRAAAAGGAPRPAELARSAQDRGGTRFVHAALDLPSMDELKAYAKDVRAVLGSGVIALALAADEPQLFVTVSDDLVARGMAANVLIAAGAPAIDGKGGGRPEMAQARGTRRDGIEAAFAAMGTAVAGSLGEG